MTQTKNFQNQKYKNADNHGLQFLQPKNQRSKDAVP